METVQKDSGATMAEAGAESRISLSASAARRINHLARKRGGGAVLRVSVAGGGCSGFQYDFCLDEAAREDDTVVERDGARLAVDSLSLAFMAGSEVDYVEELVGSSFRVRNPKAATECSCGVSFSLQET